MIIPFKESECEFINIEQEYKVNTLDPFSNDSYVLRRLNELHPADRRLLIIYAELGSLRKVAKLMNVSHGTIKNKIDIIKKEFDINKKWT